MVPYAPQLDLLVPHADVPLPVGFPGTLYLQARRKRLRLLQVHLAQIHQVLPAIPTDWHRRGPACLRVQGR